MSGLCTVIRAMAALLALGLLVGCGAKEAADRVARQNDLKAVVLMYISFEADNGRPPANLEDLQKYKAENAGAYQLVQDGKFIVIWKASTARQPDGTSKVVLAYDAAPDAKGNRLVATADGATKVVTEQEFNAMPKAKTN